MKNFFNVKLYLEGLRKIRVAGVAAAASVIALNALLPIVGIIESATTRHGASRSVSAVDTVAFAPFGLLMMVFSLILTYSMFSYLNERSKSDFWHAAPQKRTTVYFSFVAAIYTWIAGILLVSGLLNLVLWNVAKYYSASFVSFIGSFGVYLLVSVMLVGFMTLAMTLTGTTLSNLLIFALVLFFVRAVGAIFTATIETVAPMFDPSYSILRFFSMEFFLPYSVLADIGSVGYKNTFSDAPLLIYSVFVSLLLLALGALGYCRRKSEAASYSAPGKRMQHVYRCAITLPFCFLLVYFLFESIDVSLFIVMAILILLVWILFELMTTKKIKNVVRSLPVLAVPLVLSLLFTGSVYLTRDVIWNDLPAAEEISGVGVPIRSTHTYEQLMTADVKVEDKAMKQLVAEALEDTMEAARKNANKGYIPGKTQRVVITLSSGRTMGRKLYLSDSDYALLTEGFYNSDEYRNAYLSMPTDKQIQGISVSRISAEKGAERLIWDTFLSEYKLLSDADKRAIKDYYTSGTLRDKYVTSGAVSAIYVSGQINMTQYASEYPVFYCYTPKTAQLILELMNEESISGGKATDDIALIADLLRVSLESQSGMNGYIGVTALYGADAISNNYFNYGFSEEKCVDAVLALIDFLSALEDPDDYRGVKGNNVLQLELSVDVNVVTKPDTTALEEVQKDSEKAVITVEYQYLEVPVSLNDEEMKTFVALWEKVVTSIQ